MTKEEVNAYHLTVQEMRLTSGAQESFKEKLHGVSQEESDLSLRRENASRRLFSLPVTKENSLLKDILFDFFEHQRSALLTEKKKWQRLIHSPIKLSRGSPVFDLSVIKSVPIESLFPFERVRESSSRITAICPFHEERTPSFVIYKEHNNYHCFGCGENGDSISFVMKRDQVDFKEACRKLQ